MHQYLYKGGDTISYFNESKILMSALPGHPEDFLRLTLGYTVKPPPADLAAYESQMIYWNVVNSYFMVRLNALMNLISFNHYFVNVVIYNFLTLIGTLYLFKWFFDNVTPQKTILIFFLFFFPSVAFWAAGLHKDGLSIAAIGLILFHFQKILQEIKWKYVVALFFGCWLLLMVRNYLLLLLIPCLLAYAFTIRFPKNGIVIFAITFLGFYFLIFKLDNFFPVLNLLSRMTEQQQEFLISKSAVTLPVYFLDGTFTSFSFAIPTALSNCLIHPFILKINSLYHLPFAIDNLLLFLLFIACFIFPANKGLRPGLILCIFVSISIFLFAGSIVPNLGALVRYKMPGMLFLAVAIVSMIDSTKTKNYMKWNQISQAIYNGYL
ncbi:MAG: hypothetical protein ABIO46_02680 [Chitinophagales bacterium]